MFSISHLFILTAEDTDENDIFSTETEEDIFSEEELFSDGEDVIIDDATPGDNDEIVYSEDDLIITEDEITDEDLFNILDSESVTFTGDISSIFGYSFKREVLLEGEDFKENTYSTYMEADLLLDVRLKKGIKAFGNLGVGYFPAQTLDTAILLKEFFIDLNYENIVYLRAGKQVLTWGRGYLWNPTDLLNRERKSFIDMDALREGVYGLKMHIPFGTLVNIYGFLDTTDAQNVTDFAAAAKLEFLIFNTEIAVSGWFKDKFIPVFGIDFSTRLFDIDLYGEASISYGDNIKKYSTVKQEFISIRDEWVTQISIGGTIFFDLLDVKDRISLTGELYYNHAGYEDNVFESEALGTFFESGDLIHNRYGIYYGAFYLNANKFLLSDMVLNISTIGNFSDISFMVNSGITYNPVNNFTLGFNIIANIGEEYKEYTVAGIAMSANITASLSF